MAPQQGYGAPQNQMMAGPMGAMAGAVPTNAWFPAAVISWLFPGLGLLMLKDKNRTKFAVGIFVAYLVIAVVLGVLQGIFYSMDIPALGGIIALVAWLVRLVAHFGSMILTHDETVRAYPHLGAPIFFKQPINVPASLQ